MKILVTGGAGFIGSAYVRKAALRGDELLIIDKMTYASSRAAIAKILLSTRVTLVEKDICDQQEMVQLVAGFGPDYIVHFAAESHVDNSIASPDNFIQTNIMGTYSLLNAALANWQQLPLERRHAFRFHHVSTDEVYGDLPHPDDANTGNRQAVDLDFFVETTPYRPSSPYSASKAASDHLVKAWNRTYGLPVTISNCSNNFGPFQHPEKLLPKTILNALSCQKIPIFGDGRNIRDWLFVDDHIDAIDLILTNGRVGETYNVGANAEITNIDLVKIILDKLEVVKPISENLSNDAGYKSYHDLITYVEDRFGHDLRYGIDATKIRLELGWQPSNTIDTGLDKLIAFAMQRDEVNTN